jgi:sterol desaturase/sphingolipid hydroxylase (fatty acid hydroxylase superfamily)
MVQRTLSWLFLFGFVALGIFAVQHFTGADGHIDTGKLFLYFLAPYYILCTAMQYVWPEQPNDFEKGEVATDWLHNGALFAISGFQNYFIHVLVAMTGAGVLFKYGVLPEAWAAHHLPFWGEVLVAYLTFDFMFYVTHRMGHEIDFFWRLHSVHHCAGRLSVLNASRAHPADLIWRRFVPIFVTFQTGVSQEAFIMSGVIGSVLATITHMNVRFDFGPLNYVIGTNEAHRWHHSNKIEEAKNYSVFMLWDHLFGTFVWEPKGQKRPAKMGLFNENFYPRHSYLGQFFVPLKWKAMKAQQAQLEAQQAGHPAGGGSATAQAGSQANVQNAGQGEPRPA